MSSGWSVCWHETGALELITEIVEELQQTPKSDTGENTRADEPESTEPATSSAEGQE